MDGEPPLQQVCSLTKRAHELGMTHGMTQVEVETVSRVKVLRRSKKEEAVAREVLLECAGGFSPRIEDRSENDSFLCVLDIAGMKGIFGPPETLAQSLLDRVRLLGITACVSVSSNLHAAIATAKAPLPLSVRIIPPGEESTALAALPLTVLDLSEQQTETFSLWGIHNLGMLAALPDRELISRIGQSGKRLRQMARGQMPHLFQPVEPVFVLRECMELDSPIEVLDALMFVANLLLEKIILRAAVRVLALASVGITLTLEGGAAHTRTVRPALPTNDRQLWIKLLHLDLEAHPPQAPILVVSLDAESGATSQVQLGLFSPQLPEPSRLDVTLARIRAIVGDGNVGSAVLIDTQQHDDFRLEPFRVYASESSELPPASLFTAMRRIRPAETITVSLQNKCPKTFVFRNQRYAVERAYGPWRTGGQWWARTTWRCEQWDLVANTDNGSVLCCCVVRDLLREQWKMVALYD
jgi:protein ImuB